jgi:cytochrome c5
MNSTLRTICACCGKPIPTETGSAHPLDESVRRETYGLVGNAAGRKTIFATCAACHDGGWRPAPFRQHTERGRQAGLR